jgi:transcriptional regulator with XRE-family HTH domain
MRDVSSNEASLVADKIARLVEERGWNMDEFARLAGLNRLTVRQIVQGGKRRLHNATIGACARALGVSVHELRSQPLDHLLPRMRRLAASGSGDNVRRLYEEATQPELRAWLDSNPERGAQLTPEELDELLSLQGTGGPLTTTGVEYFVDLLERRRKLKEQVDAVAGTEYLDMLEKFVALLYEKIQPYRDRTKSP